jgi:hypothetical protein
MSLEILSIRKFGGLSSSSRRFGHVPAVGPGEDAFACFDTQAAHLVLRCQDVFSHSVPTGCLLVAFWLFAPVLRMVMLLLCARMICRDLSTPLPLSPIRRRSMLKHERKALQSRSRPCLSERMPVLFSWCEDEAVRTSAHLLMRTKLVPCLLPSFSFVKNTMFLTQKLTVLLLVLFSASGIAARVSLFVTLVPFAECVFRAHLAARADRQDGLLPMAPQPLRSATPTLFRPPPLFQRSQSAIRPTPSCPCPLKAKPLSTPRSGPAQS